MTDAPDQGDLVGLEAHPGAPSESEPPPGQTPLDVLGGDQQSGGHSLHDHHQGAAVGLTSGQIAQHGGKSTRGRLVAGLDGGGGDRQVPAWNSPWAMEPPQKTAMAAPAANDGAKGMRVFRPVEETAIITRPNSIPTMKPARKAR